MSGNTVIPYPNIQREYDQYGNLVPLPGETVTNTGTLKPIGYTAPNFRSRLQAQPAASTEYVPPYTVGAGTSESTYQRTPVVQQSAPTTVAPVTVPTANTYSLAAANTPAVTAQTPNTPTGANSAFSLTPQNASLPSTSPLNTGNIANNAAASTPTANTAPAGTSAGSKISAAAQGANAMGKGFSDMVSADVGAFGDKVAARYANIDASRDGLAKSIGGEYGDIFTKSDLIRPDENVWLNNIPDIDKRTRVMSFMTKYNQRTMEGASAGSAGGPWGALIGGVAGSIVGGIEGIAGVKRMKTMNKEIREELLAQYEATVKRWNEDRLQGAKQVQQRRVKKDRAKTRANKDLAALNSAKKSVSAKKAVLGGMGQKIAKDQQRLAYEESMAGNKLSTSAERSYRNSPLQGNLGLQTQNIYGSRGF